MANAAVLENSDLTEISPASCTLAMGLVSGRQLLASTLGDSRVYWLPDDGAAVLLSTDDSVAQEQIDAGMDARNAPNRNPWSCHHQVAGTAAPRSTRT